MEPQLKVPLDDRGKRSVSLRGDLIKAFNPRIEKNRPLTPSSLDIPAFLMNFPFTIDDRVANNALMKSKEPYNFKKASKQFIDLYHLISKESIVYLLPHEDQLGLQDLPFVANLGCYLPHIKPDTIIVSNFKSQPRKGEDRIGIRFFDSMGYTVARPKTHWEGEADLKYLKNNLWIGGYGIRTDIKSFHWMMDKFNMNIITVKMQDEKLYHFDCQFFPLSSDKALVSTTAFKPEDLKKIEKHVEIVDVPKEFMYDGWTNSVRLGKKILCGKTNKRSDAASDAIFEKHGYEPVGVDLSEFAKSGGDLSCLVMHFSYKNRQ